MGGLCADSGICGFIRSCTHRSTLDGSRRNPQRPGPGPESELQLDREGPKNQAIESGENTSRGCLLSA